MSENFQNALAVARQQLEIIEKRKKELEQEKHSLSVQLGKLQRVIDALVAQLKPTASAQQSKGEQG